MDMYLPGNFYAKNLIVSKYLKILKLPVTFLSLLWRLFFKNISFMFTLSQLTWSDVSKSAKC